MKQLSFREAAAVLTELGITGITDRGMMMRLAKMTGKKVEG